MLLVCRLKDIVSGDGRHFGGKADALAVLVRMGVPVPEGIGIAAEAFEKETLGLSGEAEGEVFAWIRSQGAGALFAVRSSALCEDGEHASFAGVFESVLNVREGDILLAILHVAGSSRGARAAAYSPEAAGAGLPIGVIIQKMVDPDFAGVLFTSDPLTGDAATMSGNFVRGLAEQMVSGDCDARVFSIDALSGKSEGDALPSSTVKKLRRYALRLVKVFGKPLDIEWAVRGGRVFLLQARPITTLSANRESFFDINDALSGAYLLTRTNVGEVFMRPVSPATHGVFRGIFDRLGLPLMADVRGQMYCNLSAVCSLLVSLGFSRKRAFALISDIAGKIPDGLSVPVYPFDRNLFLRKILHMVFSGKRGMSRPLSKKLFRSQISTIADSLINRLRAETDPLALVRFWKAECEPFSAAVLRAIVSGLSLKPLLKSRALLQDMVGDALADALCSNASAQSGLDSLAPLLALEELIDGDMDEETYLRRFGHRHADEMEIACPYPYEIPGYVESAIRDYQKSGVRSREMKAAQERRFNDAKNECRRLFPRRLRRIERIISRYAEAVSTREQLRGQSVKLMCLMREFYLRSATLLALDTDTIFLFYFDELFDALEGREFPAVLLTERQLNYAKNAAMPSFPNVICGRFEPDKWVSDPDRRADYFVFGGGGGGVGAGGSAGGRGADITGVGGSSGKVTGRVRLVSNLSEAELIEPGEILVANAVNIGWLPVLPRAAAVVTDIGAALSHAVIVMRELGIPAVVGCGNATTLLRTGDRVTVDGSAGTVSKVGEEGASEALLDQDISK
jgi:pyruvate,water dikinase